MKTTQIILLFFILALISCDRKSKDVSSDNQDVITAPEVLEVNKCEDSLNYVSKVRVYDAQELTEQAYSMDNLDSIYKNGLYVNDTLNHVFTQLYLDSVVLVERIKLFNNLSNYLKNNGFKWDSSINMWTSIYCDTNGDIDYFLYHFMRPVDKTKEIEFKRLVNKFLLENKISVTASQKFHICGHILFKDD